ncbi:MAG: acyl--CoA ligase [Caulobacterales bacterium]|nr:acyl--CoA ligase [Caulobacterales bacterium]
MFDGYVRDYARWTPRAPAVVTPGRIASYGEFDADIDRCGAALAGLGLRRGGGVVSLRVEAPYLAYVALAACARLGIATAPGNDEGADRVLTDREAGPDPRAVRLNREWVQHMFAAEPRPLPRLTLDPAETARVMLSSGTTRKPRRVALSWARLEAGALANLRGWGLGKLGTWFPITSVDSLMGFGQAWVGWGVGAAVGAGVSAEALPGWLELLPEGVACMTPANLRQVLAALPAGFKPQPGWRIVTAGSLLPRPVAEEAALRITPDIRILYGSTEASLLAAGYAADLAVAPGCVGATPAGALVKLVGDDGEPVPEGQAGEVRIATPRMTVGYVDDPDGTAERFEDGWFLTRDVARRLPDGRLVLEGRLDERMILGGQKFMPGVLEEAALACPGVLDAAAFAVPDADGMDRCWLAVAVAQGFDRERLAQHLAGYGGLPPRRFAWVEAVPRNAMGKVERDRLRQAILAIVGGGDGA